jgi:hypothetical protein
MGNQDGDPMQVTDWETECRKCQERLVITLGYSAKLDKHYAQHICDQCIAPGRK